MAVKKMVNPLFKTQRQTHEMDRRYEKLEMYSKRRRQILAIPSNSRTLAHNKELSFLDGKISRVRGHLGYSD